MFSIVRSVWTATSPSTSVLVSGSIGPWPEQKTSVSVTMAWL